LVGQSYLVVNRSSNIRDSVIRASVPREHSHINSISPRVVVPLFLRFLHELSTLILTIL